MNPPRPNKWRAAPDIEAGEIRQRLMSSGRSGDIFDLASAWFEIEQTWRIADVGNLVGDPGLAGRIRGAWGSTLLEAASPEAAAGQPCRWTPPCAFEVLFRKQGRLTPRLDLPSPWVIDVDAYRGDLLVTLRLFGFACDWAVAAFEAMTTALARRTDLAGKTGLFVPKQLEINRSVSEARPFVQPIAGPLRLNFLSPAATSSREADPRALLSMLAPRIAGLARWQDIAFRDDVDAWSEAMSRLDIAWELAEKIVWDRGSRKQDRSIPMHGIVGQLAVSGNTGALQLIAPYLAIGERVHLGADIAFGCGRYQMQAL